MKAHITILLISFTVFIPVNQLFSQTPVQLGEDILGESADDASGWSTSISSDGSRVAIGAFRNDINGSNAGQVRIFDWDGSGWVQTGLDIVGEAAGDLCGHALSLSAQGDRVAVGAFANNGNGTQSGHARVFEWDGENWNQLGSDIDGEAAFDESGWSVSLDSLGNRVVIGGYLNSGNGIESGHVRVFDWDGENWNQLGNDIDGEAAGDQMGISTSISADGNRIAVGARKNDEGGMSAGHVRVYEWNTDSWNQFGNDINGESAGDQSGTTLSITSDGNRVAIGAYGNSENGTESGHVRIYDWNGTTWEQAGDDLDGQAAYDWFGRPVSLSSDGKRLAIGSRFNDTNGNNAGLVRLYEWTDNNWAPVCEDIVGEFPDDRMGSSISLSADGSILAVGALGNDTNGVDAGYVQVYECNTTVSTEPLTSYTSISISPNPTTGFLQLDGFESGTIRVLDQFGRNRMSIKEMRSTLDLTHLRSGVYYLQICLKGKIFTQKLIKI